MIDAGLEPLAEGRCPDCAGERFNLGPRGALSVNIECAGCSARFNVCVWGHELVHAQRIENTGDWPDRGEWKL